MELQLKGLHRYFLSTIFPANKDIILVLEIVDSPFVPAVGYLYKNIQRSSFLLIGTVKDWDKFSGIVGVSLSHSTLTLTLSLSLVIPPVPPAAAPCGQAPRRAGHHAGPSLPRRRFHHRRSAHAAPALPSRRRSGSCATDKRRAPWPCAATAPRVRPGHRAATSRRGLPVPRGHCSAAPACPRRSAGAGEERALAQKNIEMLK